MQEAPLLSHVYGLSDAPCSSDQDKGTCARLVGLLQEHAFSGHTHGVPQARPSTPDFLKSTSACRAGLCKFDMVHTRQR